MLAARTPAARRANDPRDGVVAVRCHGSFFYAATVGDAFSVGIVVVIIQGIFTLVFMLLRFMFELLSLAVRAASRSRR